jgi:zinc transporter ZupT
MASPKGEEEADEEEFEEVGFFDKLLDKFGEGLIKNPHGVALFINEVVDGIATSWSKATERRYKKEMRISLMLVLFLAFVMMLMATLVYYDKLNGETMAFLVGSIIGYLFAFMKQHLFPGI